MEYNAAPTLQHYGGWGVITLSCGGVWGSGLGNRCGEEAYCDAFSAVKQWEHSSLMRLSNFGRHCE